MKILIVLTILCAFIGCKQQIESIPERSSDEPDSDAATINEQPRDTTRSLLFNLDDIPSRRVMYKSRPEPVFPEEAKLAKKGGKVVIQLTVNENGMPEDIKALTDLGYGLEEAAIEAIQKTTFYPAMQGKRPMRKKVEIPMTFLYEKELRAGSKRNQEKILERNET